MKRKTNMKKMIIMMTMKMTMVNMQIKEKEEEQAGEKVGDEVAVMAKLKLKLMMKGMRSRGIVVGVQCTEWGVAVAMRGDYPPAHMGVGVIDVRIHGHEVHAHTHGGRD
jgi:hypothetical protein